MHPAEKPYSRRNLDFLLFEVLDSLSLTRHAQFAGHDRETMGMVLDSAENIAAKILRPAYVESDRRPPELIHGEVKVHPALAAYYRAFCESGLMTACLEEEQSGQQLPKTTYAAANFILGSGHNGFEMFTSLAGGAATILQQFAGPELVQTYLDKILTGRYSATMCLTEPGAGSSLGDIVTEAIPAENGAYQIRGQKIFISAGDQDFTENILHLVLARVKGAAAGVKGISLFLVPKKREINGKLQSNDVQPLGIYHKMGQRSTPAMHLEFGSRSQCRGWLIGKEGEGLLYMFQMMNGARLAVGLAGAAIASAAYYASLQYARERPQGRRLNHKNPLDPPITIIHHPDVRRMLFLQKAMAEGCLSLLLQCYLYADREKVSAGEEKQRFRDLLDLMTPLAKTCGAEMGQLAVSNGLQVLGGYGYTQDFILEQLYRDVRILSIYEGTTGIQSQTLLGRQLPRNGGKSLRFWKEEVSQVISKAKEMQELEPYARRLEMEIEEFDSVNSHLQQMAVGTDPEIFLSDANLFMEYFSLLNLGWQWLAQALQAGYGLASPATGEEDRNFYLSKRETMIYYFHYELGKTRPLAARLKDDKRVTLWKENDPLI